jgi:hypothetical protein
MSNLILRALLACIEDIARAKGVRSFRVATKRNARGELVVALIIADKDGPFGPMSTSDVEPSERASREAKRQSRERR